MDAITVGRADDLDPVSRWLDEGERPLLIDAKVNPDIRAEWRSTAFHNH